MHFGDYKSIFILKFDSTDSVIWLGCAETQFTVLIMRS